MKRFTNALFAAALLAGGASVMVPAATAAPKDKKADAAALKLSKEVQAPAAAAQTALAANDLATAETSTRRPRQPRRPMTSAISRQRCG